MSWREEDIYDSRYGSGRDAKKFIFWAFFGIIGFCAIYFPFFAPNLRYTTSAYLKGIFTPIGTISITLGSLMVVWGLFSLFCSHRKSAGIKLMIMGVLLIWVGMYFTSFVVDFSFPVGSSGDSERSRPKGYH